MDRQSAKHAHAADQNNPGYDPQIMTSNLQYPTTPPPPTKKNTSPTKKVLPERNGSSMPNLGIKPSNSQFELETRLQAQICSGDDKSCRPYNPQTNYLSQRPRFLRYDPNRRREIFRRLEKGATGLDSSSSMSSSCASSDSNKAVDEDSIMSSNCNSLSSSSSETGSWASEGEESDGESHERTQGLSFRWVFKYLLLVVLVLAFSTFSINPPGTTSFEGLENGEYLIEDREDFFGGDGTEMVVSGLGGGVVDGNLACRDELSELVELMHADFESAEETMEFMQVKRELPDQMIGYVELLQKEIVDRSAAFNGYPAETFPQVLDHVSDTASATEKAGATVAGSFGDEEGQFEHKVYGDVAANTKNAVRELEERVDEHSNSSEDCNSQEAERAAGVRFGRFGAESTLGVASCFAVLGASVLGFCIRRKKLHVAATGRHWIEKEAGMGRTGKSAWGHGSIAAEKARALSEGPENEHPTSVSEPSLGSPNSGVKLWQEDVRREAPKIGLPGELDLTVGSEKASALSEGPENEHPTSVSEPSLGSPNSGVKLWQEDVRREAPKIGLLGELYLTVGEMSNCPRLMSCGMKMKVGDEVKYRESSGQTKECVGKGNQRSGRMAKAQVGVGGGRKEVMTPVRRSARIRSRGVAAALAASP